MDKQKMIQTLKDPETVKAAVNEIFAKVDTDKSGKIDRKELKAGLKGLSKDIGIPEPNDKDVDETLRALDSNNDNQIDKNEMAELVKALFQIMIEEIQNS